MQHDMFDDVSHVVDAFQSGFGIGTIANDHYVQPYLDSISFGSGPEGHDYLDFINTYGDPLDVVDTISDSIEAINGW